jgi:diguanylate cyclase (GGDEF)-like protein
MKILIVDDSATARAALARYVERMGHETVWAGSGKEALERFAAVKPDMILLDVQMGDMDGYSVAQRIRRAPDAQWVPIIFLSSREEDQDLQSGIEAGGDDYLVKPVSYVVLHAKVRAMQRIDDMRRRLVRLSSELEAANRELERLSHFDGLTGIANRRFLDNVLAREIGRATRASSPLSVCLIDIDHFKTYNDQYGHVMGDECLTRVAQTIELCVKRAGDLAARYGGEEFCVVLPSSDLEAARLVAEKIRQAVIGLTIPHGTSAHRQVTISIGVCCLVPDRHTDANAVIKLADAALYRAKQYGRNRVMVALPEDHGKPAATASGAA